MTAPLPKTDTLLLDQSDGVLHITLNRPASRNAMNLDMVHELMTVFATIKTDRKLRAVVLRGAGGNFCAGGDIKDMSYALTRSAKEDNGSDPFYALNRAFGHMITQVNRAPQVVIAVLEGVALGGGLGLACTSDVAIANKDTVFGFPETGLGIPPAQIAPFVVERIGITHTRRLALLGARFTGEEALQLGVIHHCCDNADQLAQQLADTLALIKCCAPQANAVTKDIILNVGVVEHEQLLDQAAQYFAAAVQGPEGQEGMLAFIEKRKPRWALD